MKSRIAGELTPSDHDEDFFESQPIEIPYFNNRKLKINFLEAKHEPYLKEADEVLEKFLKLDSVQRTDDSRMVHQYYSETLKHGYCENLNLSSISEIWNFITPNEIMIDWEAEGKFYLLVSCECSWEEEHGLQLVFKNGEQLTRAGGHDGHYGD